MPESEVAKRGGAIRYRTICVKHGKSHKCDGGYIHIAVVRRKGKRGGSTVAGPVHH